MKITIFSIKEFVAKLLYHAYAFEIEILRKNILRIVKRLEDGELYSTTLRQIYISYHGISIGLYSYGGCFSKENILSGTEIGRYCSFAKNVYIYTRNHPYMYKSTHPFFYNIHFKILEKDFIPISKVIIGNDVWIGMNVIILPSVSTVGDGAVIGAGSIVTKDVPPYAIVAGNPAKIIKYRFEQDKIQQLIDSKWWDKSINELKSEIRNFTIPLEDI